MSLDFLNEYLVPIVIAACLVIGYCIKQIDKIPNNIIPTVLAIIGAKKAGPRASGQPYRKEER